MQSRPICLVSLATALILCSSCSKNEQQSGQSQQTGASSSPDISPSAAPGVAFNFNFDFNLPDERISAAQEAHASACEKLGLEQCRITGMSYDVDQDEQVTAELDLKLDPLIARQFGKSAQQLIERSDGKLVRLQIGSSNEGQAIEQAAKQKRDTTTQIAELQQELARSTPGSRVHANLLTQVQALQQQAAEQTHAIEAGQATLASTPMEFHYYGRGGVPGFRGNPIREAWHTFLTIVIWLVGTLLQGIAVLVPLGVLIAIMVAIWRSLPVRVFRRWIRGPKEAEA
jgi:hypothetical protein